MEGAISPRPPSQPHGECPPPILGPDKATEFTETNVVGVPKAEAALERPAQDKERSVESREADRRARERLLSVLSDRGLDPRVGLEIVASFDPEAIDDELDDNVRKLADSYGLRLEDMPEAARFEVTMLAMGIERSRSDQSQKEVTEALEQVMGRELFGTALYQIDQLEAALSKEQSDMEALKGSLREVMFSINLLSKRVPLEKKANREMWQQLYDRFNVLSAMRHFKDQPDLKGAFSAVFDEFSGFIEDDLLEYRMRSGGSKSVEHEMRRLYGRSKEEVEEIKKENRQNVAAEITEMTEQPYLTVEMIERLHEINNRGIVPKRMSKLRQSKESIMTFGTRLGLLGEDVRPEMERFVERVNGLIDRDILKDMSKLRYEIEAAKLHNEMLDMHPFDDRNGSTSMLFLELMMARKGYHEPSPVRDNKYYNYLRKVLDNNPVAMSVVGYEQYSIMHRPGYFEGETITDKKREEYDKIVGRLVARRERLIKEARAKKKAKDKPQA